MLRKRENIQMRAIDRTSYSVVLRAAPNVRRLERGHSHDVYHVCDLTTFMIRDDYVIQINNKTNIFLIILNSTFNYNRRINPTQKIRSAKITEIVQVNA